MKPTITITFVKDYIILEIRVNMRKGETVVIPRDGKEKDAIAAKILSLENVPA